LNVTLHDITEDNFEDFMEMELPEYQRDLLASNAFSIAQSRFYPDYIPRGVYCDGKPAGFLYDRRAMELLLVELRAMDDVRRITICYHTRNERAQAFYASFGFIETGIDESGEMVAELRVA
jgi:diamine N-acetyltransferase